MRKVLSYLIAVCIIASAIFTNTHGQQFTDEVKKSVEKANTFLKEKLDLEDYYIYKTNDGELNGEFAVNGTSTFFNKPIFVYGDQVSASKAATTNGKEYDKQLDQYRAMGYARDGSTFSNPKFPYDNEGYLAKDRKWIEKPWGADGVRRLFGEDGTVDSRKMTTDKYGGLDYIKKWIKSVGRFEPDSLENYDLERNFFTVNATKVPEAIKNNFEDFLFVIQPPTEHSWGLGIAFYYWNSEFNLNYRSFLIQPFDMVTKDLSVELDPIPSSAKAGDDVLVGIRVKSTFEEELKDIYFKWEITKTSDNASVEAVFLGHADTREGYIAKIPAKGEAKLYAAFKMPDSNVKVKFEANKDGTNPKETNLSNNATDGIVKAVIPVHTVSDFQLDYNILSKKVKFPLLNGAGITAHLTAPRGSLIGNAWGALNITNSTPNIYSAFKVNGSPSENTYSIAVTEPAGTITKYPQIESTMYRKNTTYISAQEYDDPQNGKWLNGLSEKKTNGIVSFGGTAYANYFYYCSGCQTDSDGESYCDGHTKTTSAAFTSGTDTRTITTKIYNGMPTIKPKVYDNKIDFNNTNSEQKNMYWTSEPYKYNVIRWMCHEDENGGLYNWTKVNGQYQRTFTQQNSAIIKWSTASTMKNDYYESRAAAKTGAQAKGKYDKAIFATDKSFKSVDYPIKSGYYFNPTGTYTFTVETVTYKPTQADTKEHKDLVNSVINAFRYESDLMYINKDKKAVNLQGELLPKNGNSFKRKAASLTAQDPTGVDGVVLLNVLDRTDSQSRYSKKVEEIYHAETSDGITHEYWKAILEGYIESETQGSEKFKYKEYVKAGQYMYRITEKTTVTIEINSGNKKVYTHAHMPDGKYTIKAWIDDAALTSGNNEYKKLGTLKGIASLDKIEVSVVGSMYEDTN